MYSIIGAILILTVIVSSGMKKILDELPADHDIKTKCLAKCYAQKDNNSGQDIDDI